MLRMFFARWLKCELSPPPSTRAARGRDSLPRAPQRLGAGVEKVDISDYFPVR